MFEIGIQAQIVPEIQPISSIRQYLLLAHHELGISIGMDDLSVEFQMHQTEDRQIRGQQKNKNLLKALAHRIPLLSAENWHSIYILAQFTYFVNKQSFLPFP